MPLIKFLGKGIWAAVFFPPRQSVSHLHLYLNQLKKNLPKQPVIWPKQPGLAQLWPKQPSIGRVLAETAIFFKAEAANLRSNLDLSKNQDLVWPYQHFKKKIGRSSRAKKDIKLQTQEPATVESRDWWVNMFIVAKLFAKEWSPDFKEIEDVHEKSTRNAVLPCVSRHTSRIWLD